MRGWCQGYIHCKYGDNRVLERKGVLVIISRIYLRIWHEIVLSMSQKGLAVDQSGKATSSLTLKR